jgi:CheY-like chemotaxis protein
VVVGDIRAAVGRGAALTRQLLAFGRKEVHAPGLVDLNEVMTNVERLLARVLGKHIRIELQKGPHIAPVVADTSQMEQVIVNLAINARDAMPRGGVLTIATGVVTVDADEAATLGVLEGSYVTLAVMDTGVGMDLETRTRAFEPFFTTKAPTQGSGLGLSTVYGIARQSGGTVTIDSVPGKGTCVRLHLPRSSAGERLRSPTPARGMAIHGRGRILLVEDEPRVRTQARRLLERAGYTVIEAADGEQGEREFRTHGGTIDAVVTDVVMPGLGGADMVARLRELAPAVPVVFVSGFTAEDRDLPLDERTRFVSKPYTIAALCEAIAEVTAV